MTMPEQNRPQLDAYGSPLFAYQGHGTIRWNDRTSRALAFEAGQFPNGKIIVVGRYDDVDHSMWFGGGGQSPEPDDFSGVTSEGWTLRSVGPFFSTNYLPRMQGSGSFDAFRLRQLDCERAGDAAAIAEYRFGLVNFHFHGTRAATIERSGGIHYLRGLPVPMRVGSATVDAMIVPVEDSDTLHRRIITDKSCAVLAELIVPATSGLDLDDLTAGVGKLCTVLSVMRGTKVQWIYRNDWRSGIIRTTHRAGITKAYSPLAPLDSDYKSLAASAQFIVEGLAAIESSPILKQDPAVVDAYLDAKVEHDFLETQSRVSHRKTETCVPPVRSFTD